jgi:NADH:ubiquinone oxidoreductase subunit 2 (subunit N)
MYLTLFFNNFFIEYGFSILLLNIASYLIILFLLFSVFFSINVKYIKTLNELNVTSNNNFFMITIILVFLSLAGMPPLLGFLGKFLIIIFLLYKNFFFFFFIFVLINVFMIYFYIQNVRFLVKKTSFNKSSTILSFNNINLKIIFFMNLINFLNFFGLFFIEDIVIILSSLSIYIYI